MNQQDIELRMNHALFHEYCNDPKDT